MAARLANSVPSSDAPPTSAPSTSVCAVISATLPDFTEPPYRMRIAVGDLGAVLLGQRGASGAADLLGVGRGRHPAGADRPDRLVGQHDAGGLLGRDVDHGGEHLVHGVLDLVAGLADLQPLAEAQHRDQPVPVGGVHLLGQQFVGLVVVLAALGVTDQHIGAAELGQLPPEISPV